MNILFVSWVLSRLCPGQKRLSWGSSNAMWKYVNVQLLRLLRLTHALSLLRR